MKVPAILCSIMLAVSCGPTKYSMTVEMRHGSESGVDLAGKSVSVVYVESGHDLNDAIAASVADGFAYSIEEDYGLMTGSVGVYHLPLSDSSVYRSKDRMIDLLVDTDADVVFVLDTLQIGRLKLSSPSRLAIPVSADSSYLSTASGAVSAGIYCLDGMDRSETIRSFTRKSALAVSVYSGKNETTDMINQKVIRALPDAAFVAGQEIAGAFLSQWTPEQYSIICYETDMWYQALSMADSYRWKDAMDIWMDLLDTQDVLKRSCAEYNIALACYMLGDYSLALQWLDRSDSDSAVSLSPSLRKRIKQRMN